MKEGEEAAILLVRLTMSFLSLAGALVMMSCTLYFRQYTSTAARLLFYLMASTLASNIFNLLSLDLKHIGIEPHDSVICTIQGAGLQWSQQAVFCWVCVMATHLFIKVVLRRRPGVWLEVNYHIIVWSIATVLTIIPVAEPQGYGPGVWCGVVNSNWRLLSFYVPLFVYIGYLLLAYLCVFIAARKMLHGIKLRHLLSLSHSSPDITKIVALLRRLAIYPAIFVAVWIFPIINRIQNSADPNHKVFVLYLLQSLTSPGFGFYNAVFYAYDARLVQRLVHRFTRRHAKKGEADGDELTGFDDHTGTKGSVVPNAT
eukprot:TRINITY_DN18548_c0_g1_i1.p1 TRINITY_DN18548_c0_g1~~TRINITY_DN18548_c0_g1_i1.p1  ORF type:complete len:338 (-),score=104.84 TRINITY_DN18548_c0_g1_i1:61-1002(-)